MSAEHGKTADTPTTYRKAYDRGWAASMHGAGEVGADGKTALERADDRGEVAAWYDGYNDHTPWTASKWATYWNDHAPDTTADNTAPALPHGVSIAPLADGVECVCDSCGEIREFTGASAESDAAAWAHAAHGTCAVDCAPFKVGASVGFVAGAWRGFGDKRFTLDGMAGIVVESFAPNTGRNVRLNDGRIINAPTSELVTYAARRVGGHRLQQQREDKIMTTTTSAQRVAIGDTVRVELPFSEVCMHMRIAGRTMDVHVLECGAQVLADTGREFSFPITHGEAGIYRDAAGLYVYPARVIMGTDHTRGGE